MKTLSIQNPLAYLVVCGIKPVENRSWKTDYRGPLLIHASGDTIKPGWVPDFSEFPQMEISNEYARASMGTQDWSTAKFYGPDPVEEFRLKVDPETLPDAARRERWMGNRSLKLGLCGTSFYQAQAIVGVVDLVDIVTESKSPWAEPDSKYYWILKNAQVFKLPFLYVKGKLSLWDFDHEELSRRERVNAGG